MEEGQRVFELEPADRQLGGSFQPEERLSAQALPFGLLGGPGEIGVLGSYCFGVMVSEERRALVVVAQPLQPVRERRVEPSPSRLRKGGIGDLAGQGMLDGVLALA